MFRSGPIASMTLTLLPFLSGCVSTAYVAEYSTQYNKAVEKTNNEELLLNILRASKRRPTYFTYVTTIRGGPGWTLGSGQLTVPVGAGSGIATKSIVGGVAYTGTSGFDIGVVDTQEFMRGYTTPVSKKTFAYYWSQSWPVELLWMMFVKRIEVEIVNTPQGLEAPERNLVEWATAGNPGCKPLLAPHCETFEDNPTEGNVDKKVSKRIYTFTNYPEDEQETRRFLDLSRNLLGPKFKLAPAESEGTVTGAPLDKASAALIEQALIRANSEDYSVEEDPADKGVYHLESKGSMTLRYPGGCKSDKGASGVEGKLTAQSTGAPSAKSTQGSSSAKCKNVPKLSVYLRSPEAMLYFLGEIVRVELRGKKPIPIAMCKKVETDPDVSMVDIQELDGLSGPFPLSVQFDDHVYGMRPQTVEEDPVKECQQETTTQTLSLMSQVIALQKSAKDLPTIGVVHVSP